MENRRNKSIQREIEQGLRTPTGSFIGDPERPGLHALEFTQGWQDFEDKAPWPDNPTPSYELGRHRASVQAEDAMDIMDAINKRQADSENAIRDMLKDKPDELARFNARMTAITPPEQPSPPQSTRQTKP